LPVSTRGGHRPESARCIAARLTPAISPSAGMREGWRGWALDKPRQAPPWKRSM
jgi:hypothetical protein